jgi:hypothetical protein
MFVKSSTGEGIMFTKAVHQPYHLNYYTNRFRKGKDTLGLDNSAPYSLEKRFPLGKNNAFSEKNYSFLDNKNPSIFHVDGSAGVLYKKNSADINLAEKRVIEELRARDAEVRAHEHAHLAAAGGVATSGPKYIYMRGPDGRLYAVGGEVSIDASPVPGDPEQTIKKAQKIRRAALSPANPSGQDLRVAAAASRMEQQARAELAREKQEEKAEELGMPWARGINSSLTGYLEQIRDSELRPRLEVIYSEQAVGMIEESNQHINILA